MTFFRLLGATFRELGMDRDPRMAPTLAYYAFFSLAPLFTLSVALVGRFVDPITLESEIRPVIELILPTDASVWVMDILHLAIENSATALSVGLALSLVAGSGIFIAVQEVLNDIFHVPKTQVRGLMPEVRRRSVAFGAAASIGVMMLLVFAANTAVQLLNGVLSSQVPTGLEWLLPVIGLLSPLVSVLVLWLLFVVVYGVMPQTRLQWRAIERGALFTAVVFAGSAVLVGWVLGWIPRFGMIGAVGAVAVVLITAYLLGEVFVFGAEFTKVYSDYLRHGDIASPTVRATGEIPRIDRRVRTARTSGERRPSRRSG